jgi:hypothetical protein
MGKRGVKNWKKDKTWSDRFLPEMKRILGEHLIGEPPVEEDAERNTDLIVLKMDAVRIGCRVRKHAYLAPYGGEFTIRAGRPSGAKTELTKIIEGWGDYFLYGFSDPEEKRLCQWMLGDMKVFRLWFNRRLARNGGQSPGKAQNNRDGSSDFRAFSIRELPSEFIIAQHIDDLFPKSRQLLTANSR